MAEIFLNLMKALIYSSKKLNEPHTEKMQGAPYQETSCQNVERQRQKSLKAAR